MTTLRLDWSTAEVSKGKLTVSLDDRPSDEWAASFERTAQLLDRGTWGHVKVKKREITVKEIEAGSEDRLRFFLESAIQEANAAQGSEDEEPEASSGEAPGEEKSGAGSGGEDDPDREMTERFRGFADAAEGSSSES